MTQDTLENKRELLEEYEKSEREARRLEEALSKGRVNGLRSPSSPAEGQSQAQDEAEEPGSAFLPPHPGPNTHRRRAPGMGLLNALSYTLHGMMDVDPETARRSGISKTREGISQVCPHHNISRNQLHCTPSWKTRCISQHKISNTRVRPYRRIWIGSSGKR